MTQTGFALERYGDSVSCLKGSSRALVSAPIAVVVRVRAPRPATSPCPSSPAVPVRFRRLSCLFRLRLSLSAVGRAVSRPWSLLVSLVVMTQERIALVESSRVHTSGIARYEAGDAGSVENGYTASRTIGV